MTKDNAFIERAKYQLEQEASILTSTLMEIGETIDPYSISFPEPEMIRTVYYTMRDILKGDTQSYLDQLNEILDWAEGDLRQDVTDLIEDLKEYTNVHKALYKEETK